MSGDQPDRRRLFSVRALVFALAALAVVGYRTVDYALKRQAIRGIESLGGVVYFDDKPPQLASAPRTFKDELKQLVGLRRPAIVAISGKGVTDATLEDYVIPLTSLETVTLVDVAVSDQGLLPLASLRSLKSITCTRDPRHEVIFFRVLTHQTKIDLTLAPLHDGLLYLDDYHGIRFVVDKAALAAVGLNDELPITYKTSRQINLAGALDQMLGPHGLGWIVRDGAVVVTTRPVADQSKRITDRLRRDLPNLKEFRVDAN
jgi:hypothetical protein